MVMATSLQRSLQAQYPWPTTAQRQMMQSPVWQDMAVRVVLPIPNVYNGWVQNLPDNWKNGLTAAQLNPVP